MERTQATMKNLIWSLLYQLIYCILNFALRSIMLRTVGIECIGLNGLFANVLNILSMAELGVGSAVIYYLYKPLANDDKDEICRLMNFYKTAYRYIALVIAVIGAALVFFMPQIVKDVELDMSYVRLIYILYLIQTVASYFFAYKRSLLIADQRNFVAVRVDIVCKVLSIFGGMAVLLLTKSFVLYVLLVIAFVIINNAWVAFKVDKTYPYLKKNLTLGKEKKKNIFDNIKNIFIGQLSGKITTSTDSVLISVLVNTVKVGIYANYTMVINALTMVVEQISNAISGSVGNLVATAEKKHIDEVLSRMTFIMFAIGAFLAVPLYCLINDFIMIWLGDADLMLGESVVAVCSFNFFMMSMRVPLWRVLNVSGLFAKDKYISIAGSVTNLIVSIILGKMTGILGILIGTTCTLVIQYILKVILFYKEYLSLSCGKFLLKSALYTAAVIGEAALGRFICGAVSISNPILSFVVLGAALCAVSAAVTSAVFCMTPEFKYAKNLAFGIAGKMLKRVKG
ncbi:MAG: oligosaccharide flippase family protein [Firmicutes bacterium]|nr:oligosaccharide flippase family protein [Bacillota bacterium]